MCISIHIYTLKYSLVHLMIAICQFSEPSHLTGNWCALLSGEPSFPHHTFARFSTVFVVETSLAFTSLLWKSCWWLFMNVISNITRRHTPSQQTPWSVLAIIYANLTIFPCFFINNFWVLYVGVFCINPLRLTIQLYILIRCGFL